MKLLKIVIIILMILQLLAFAILISEPYATMAGGAGIGIFLNTSMLITIMLTPLFNFLVLLLLLLLLRKVEKPEKKKAEVPEPPF